MTPLENAADLFAKIIEATIEAKSDDGKISKWEAASLARFLPAILTFIKDREDIIASISNLDDKEDLERVKAAFDKQLSLSDELLESKIQVGVDLLIQSAYLAREISDFVKDIKDDM